MPCAHDWVKLSDSRYCRNCGVREAGTFDVTADKVPCPECGTAVEKLYPHETEVLCGDCFESLTVT